MKFFRTRRRFLILASVGILAVSAIALFPLASGRTSAPTYSRDAAKQAIDEARRARADVWAPELLLRAEAALRAASSEARREEVRFVLGRDFRAARIGFRMTRDKAQHAAIAAAEARASARTAADESLQQAAAALGEAEDLTGSVRLDRRHRRHLQRSRADMAVARVLYDDENYHTARDLAEQAVEDARAASRGAVSLASRFVDQNEVRRWRRWIEETIEKSRRTGRPAIVVNKEKNVLTLYVAGKQVRSYPADMGQNSLNAKLRAGDNATPEGQYRIVSKKGPGESRYFKALLLDYPNSEDRQRLERARRAGLVHRGAGLGSLIEIHGHGGRGENWTNGCVAVADSHMSDLFARVSEGTPVTIVGGDGRGGTFSEIVHNKAMSVGLGSPLGSH